MSNVESAERTFLATMHSIETGAEKNLATFYLMNTSPNRLGWGVSDKALEEALPTLLGKTIGCGPDYKTYPPHDPNPMTVGKWVSYNKPNGYALATAEITDDVALKNLKSGEWGPISVVIKSYKSEPSGNDNVVESFTFKTVDFVDVPAFPQAGFMNFAGLSGETIVSPIELCASFYESQSNGQAPGSPGLDPNPEELRKMQDSEKIEQLQETVTELQASIVTLTSDKKTLEATVEQLKNPDENPEIRILNEKVASMEAEKHEEILTACVEARFKAGLATDKTADAEVLKDFSDEMLKFMTLEAGKVEEMKEASVTSRPKWKYTEKGKTNLQAAIDVQREAFYFPARELEGAK